MDYNSMIQFKPPKNIFYTRRRMLDLTQKEVAETLGMSVRQYQRYERGDVDVREIPFQLGVSICELLHIDIFEVVQHLDELQEVATDFDDETFLPGHLTE